MKNLILAFFALSLAFGAVAQEQAVYTQYHVHPILVNPGYTGFADNHELLMNIRTQWTGFPGQPNTYTLMYNGALSDKLGFGAGVFSENIAAINRLKFQMNFGFRFQANLLKMGMGLSTEFHNQHLASSVSDNPNYNMGDPTVMDQIDGIQIFDATLGFHGLYDEKLFFGLALPNMIRARLDEIVTEDEENASSFFKNYLLNFGYRFSFNDSDIKFEPSMMLRKIRNVPFQIDLNAKLNFLEDKLITGVTYRTGAGNAVGILLGTNFKSFGLNYSYDLSLRDFQKYAGGSHELSVAFTFDRTPKKFESTPVK